MSDADLAERVAAAKLWLISGAGGSQRSDAPRDLPYLATALYALITVPSREVAATAVDEQWRLYVNPDWAAMAPISALGAELAHQTWHLLHDHANRARTMLVGRTTAPAWKTSSDAAIAATLEPAGLLGDLTTPLQRGLPPDLSTEEYYAMLSGLPAAGPVDGHTEQPTIGDRDDLPTCGSACDGIPRPHELPTTTPDIADITSAEADRIRRQVAIDYCEHVTSRGDRPGDALRWAKQILDPKIDWRPLLSGAVRRAIAWTNGHSEYTYTRRSRRQSALPTIVLPGTRRPVPAVAIVIDTSGSIDDLLLSQALGEVDGALAGLGVAGSAVTVLACDAAVQAVTRVRAAGDTRLAGGGGTDLRVGINAATIQRPRPEILIVISDGYTPWPDRPPNGTAVIAPVLGRDGYPLPPTPAWARRIECIL